MSDILSLIASLVTGGAPVTLGSLTFTDFAIPERVHSGTAQRKTVHRFPGGKRTIDVMGYDPTDPSFTGTFLGVDALQRRDALGQIVVAGEIVELHWGTISVPVLPHEVSFDEGFHRVEFTVTCTVLPDPDAPTQPSPVQSMLGDVGTALGLDLTGGLAAVQGGLQQAQVILQSVSGIIPGAAANVALSGVLGRMQGITQGVGAAANGNLAGLATSFSGGQFAGLLGAAGLAANAGAASGLIGRALNTAGSA